MQAVAYDPKEMEGMPETVYATAVQTCEPSPLQVRLLCYYTVRVDCEHHIL